MADALQVTDEVEGACAALKGIIEEAQQRSLVGPLARRLECSTATVYNWRETHTEEAALQRILRIALLKDDKLAPVTSRALEYIRKKVPA